MKLSDAMVLGTTTCKMKAGDINSCAIGAACNAVGMKEQGDWRGVDGFSRYRESRLVWPWLNSPSPSRYGDAMRNIYLLFDLEVCEGTMTFEELIQYVRSVEPSCGDCNEFECSCKTEALATMSELAAYDQELAI